MESIPAISPSPTFIFFLLGIFLFACYWVFNFVIFYHLTRFGVGTLPKKLAAFFLLGSILLFFLESTLYAGLDKNMLKRQLIRFVQNATNSIQIPR